MLWGHGRLRCNLDNLLRHEDLELDLNNCVVSWGSPFGNLAAMGDLIF